jgi:glycosyltransferase involved in cell wall biosynthesis
VVSARAAANTGAAPLRVALLAGGLEQGGAEKQLYHAATSLHASGAHVRVFSLTERGPYGERLRAAGLPPVWVGRFPTPPARVVDITARLAAFRPHVIQAGHSFMNLYAGLAGRALGTLSLGALRSSLPYCRAANGGWTRWLMTAPHALVTNSPLARREVCASGLLPEERVFVLPNAVDLAEFAPAVRGTADAPLTAVHVGRLVPGKRLDVFLRALAAARLAGGRVRGVVAGDGPARAAAEKLARELGLGEESVAFLGTRDDVPALLASADMFVLTSDDEGLPNALLEAMAAGLAVLTTPAGEAARLVEPGASGLLVPFGDPAALAAALLHLAQSPELRAALGRAARETVRRSYALESLPARLRALYRSAALLDGRRALAEALA